MKKVEWYYIYSQRYYPFHYYLQESIPDCFEAKGIFVDQAVFDEHLYKHKGEHFFSRITIKVETILKLLYEKRAQNDLTPFFFTDCDLLVFSNAKVELPLYTTLEKVDIVFQREFPDQEVVNPGFILMWPTDATVNLWESVLERMKTTVTMEMTCLNEILPTKQILCIFFDTRIVCSCMTICRPNFSVYHILVSGESRETDIGNKLFEASQNGVCMDKYIDMTRKQYGRLYM